MNIQRLNTTFYHITGTETEIDNIRRLFTIEDKSAYFNPLVKRGLKSPYVTFYKVWNKGLVIPSGFLQYLGFKNTFKYNFDEKEIQDHIDLIQSKLSFKFYDYQIKCIKESLKNLQQLSLAATGSGKSVIIATICSFLHSKGLKGLILVPNISLTKQFDNDLKSYNIFIDTLLIGCENNIKNLDHDLTIGTWQSVQKIENIDVDYIIVDEAHGLKLNTKMVEIVYNSTAEIRLGFTGTLPDDNISKMSLVSAVGKPIRYVRTQDLINLGLATPVNVNVIELRYPYEDYQVFKYLNVYSQRLKFIKEYKPRNELIAKLSKKINGNSVIMCSHIDQMKTLFQILTNSDNIEKDVKDFEYQKQKDVYYIDGNIKPKIREQIITELKEAGNSVLISNYQLFSTGLNIKALRNIIFASPLKSYTSITQSIGRAIRLHISKNSAEIYDLVDDISARGKSGIFYRQFKERLEKSYEPEGFPIQYSTFNFKSSNAF